MLPGAPRPARPRRGTRVLRYNPSPSAGCEARTPLRATALRVPRESPGGRSPPAPRALGRRHSPVPAQRREHLTRCWAAWRPGGTEPGRAGPGRGRAGAGPAPLRSRRGRSGRSGAGACPCRSDRGLWAQRGWRARRLRPNLRLEKGLRGTKGGTGRFSAFFRFRPCEILLWSLASCTQITGALLPSHLLECCVQFGAPQIKRDKEPLESVKWRSTKMIWVLEHFSSEDRLQKVSLFSPEITEITDISLMYINISKVDAKTVVPDSFQWC